eukprot:TRINITY_DN35106_c0_g1_i1.p1 TRINITY_DN35106_c0_g1~~TRINITY_DN35106_c0_g1_i1.p1  ORF type:complete len:241 (+),score=42.67 TRINITY_DN35106_c0_g1_i1:30-725(+)
MLVRLCTFGILLIHASSNPNERVFPKGWSPFKVLGLPESSRLPRKADLKRAHRKAALQWHPDRCKDDPKKCEKKMASVNVANEILSDDRQFQQWDAQRRERSGRGGGGGGNPFAGGGGNPFGGGGNPFGGGGFNFNFGGGGPQPRRQRPRPPPPPPRPPPPRPRPKEKGWKVVKTVEERRGESTVTIITRELPVAGGKQVKVELSEKTCYDAQKECTEKVVERWRRKRTEL